MLFGSNSAGTGQNKSCIFFLQHTNSSRVTLNLKWTSRLSRNQDQRQTSSGLRIKSQISPRTKPKAGGWRWVGGEAYPSTYAKAGKKILNQESLLQIPINLLFYAASPLSPRMAKHLSAEFTSLPFMVIWWKVTDKKA